MKKAERTGRRQGRTRGIRAWVAAVLLLVPAAVCAQSTGPGAEEADTASPTHGPLTSIQAPALALPPAHTATATPPASSRAARLAQPRVALPAYPPTQRDSLVEQAFGQPVADPYRWLEQDVRSSPDVARWVAGQNAVTAGYLAQMPGRAGMEQRIRRLFDYERISLPRRAGRFYFYLRNPGLRNQSVLHVREGLGGQERPLIDPNG